MTAIIDLDEFVGPPKVVRIAGQDYKVPADIPAETYLVVTSAAQRGLENQELIETIYPELLALFQVHQPDMERLPGSLSQIVNIIPVVYGGGAPEKEKDGPRPTTPKTRGATSPRPASSAKPRTRSRS